jgi:3-oxoacyl-[acyl-carrier protein] reductase
VKKTALVTGANRGIGAAVARRLAARGLVVAAHYAHDVAAADRVVADITAAGGAAFAVQADLGAASGPAALFDQVDAGLIARCGSTGLDVLVNNAGTSPRATLAETTPELFDAVMAVNVRGPFFVLRYALSRLREGARVINVSSTVTRTAYADVLAYSMAKGAIEVMTRTLAGSFGQRGITINAVAPGVTDTDMNAGWLRDNDEAQRAVSAATAMGRVAVPDDVAAAICLLALSDAGWITGTVLDASGGANL